MSDAFDNRPAVDRRDAEQIARQVRQALKRRMPALEPTQVSSALIAVFARYCEILIERINRAPDKALLAFVNLLGLSPHPPQPAHVPLTFSVTPKCLEVVRIPKATQVAGPPAKEQGQPVVFETEEDLYVSPLTLAAIMIRDPQRDRYGDLSHVAGAVTSPILLFEALQPTEHSLYIGQSTLLAQPCHALHVRVEALERQAPDHSAGTIQWELWNSKEWMPIVPESDETNHLTRSGRIIFRSVPGSVPCAVSKATNAWLRGRLRTPLLTDKSVESDDHGRSRTVRIKRLTLQTHRRVEKVEVTHAFVNQVPLDTSKEFYLLGQKPQFGDVLYVAQTQALGAPGGRVTLYIELLNPQRGGGSDSIRETYTSNDLAIQWEISRVKGWTVVGVSEAGHAIEGDVTAFTDKTLAFAKSGEVSFVTPPDVGPQSVNGVEAVWLRARILAGDYGREAAYSPRDSNAPEKGYVMRPATLAPPIAKNLRISMETASREETPESIMTCNDFSYRDVTSTVQEERSGFTPFTPMEGGAPVVHLGFSFPNDGVPLSGYPINIYFHCGDGSSTVERGAPTEASLDLLWEYWNGQGWSALPVVDRPDLFGQAGVLRFHAPSNWPVSTDFDKSLNWIRIRINRKNLPSQVLCRGIVPHTVMALHATTLWDEVLGNTMGTPNQSFRTRQTPVLPGQKLEVCEPVVPNMPHLRRDGDKMWVEWKGVDHFLHSGPKDRHYTIDRQTGAISFGDGKRGIVPLPGINNVVLKEYRVGGGSIGNVPAASITQLRTTIPYIQKVANLVPASGGTDSEDPEGFVPRALRLLRHRNRAVTYEDYEDLALSVSPLIAQARCVPCYDLAKDPHGQRKRSGILSLIILSRACSDRQPNPDRALLQLVWSHLKTITPPDIDICVVPPRYVPVDVNVEVVLQSDAVPAVIEQNIQEEIGRFLHPVTGGPDERGWKLGEYPQRSAFHSRIIKLPGVHHIRRVHVPDDSSALVRSGLFHICSGVHQVQSMPRSAADA
jgi:hypothetical protein